MANTPRLGLALLSVAQSSKELTLNSWLNTASVGLDNAALVTLANTFTAAANYFTSAPTVTANFGTVNVGPGGFAGSAGHYAGGASGSLLAINGASGGAADIANLQINGVSKWKLGSGGNVTLGEATNMVFGTTTGSVIATTTSQKLGFYGATPVVQITGTTDLVAGFVTSGLRAASGAVPCNLNGGQLTAGIGAFSGGLKGSGTSFQVSRLSYSFPSDANATLSASDKENIEIDIQTGVISATRTLDLVAPNAGGFWIIINREAFSVTVKIGANTGITVASHRSRIVTAPGGTNMFSLGPDQDYTV